MRGLAPCSFPLRGPVGMTGSPKVVALHDSTDLRLSRAMRRGPAMTVRPIDNGFFWCANEYDSTIGFQSEAPCR